MSIINLTKHAVNIFNENGQEVMTVEPSGFEARIKTETARTGFHGVVPLYTTTVLGTPYLQDETGNNVDMPPNARNGTIYIVGGVFRASFDRPDLYQPGQLLRDGEGKVIGCVGLSR